MPGNRVSEENLQMLYTRYRWASGFVAEKEVLEVACGPGIGLGYLARKAKKVISSDYDWNIVRAAKRYYRQRVEILQSDAHHLPFKDNSFDVVMLFEAIYYLNHPHKFLAESRRVLKNRGFLLISTVNKDWIGFNPSPFSAKYFSVPELYNLLEENGLEAQLFGNFPEEESTLSKYILLIRKMAVSLNLIPKTMKGKEKLKRLFYGNLLTLPNEIEDGEVEYSPPAPINATVPNHQYKVIFAVGHLNK